MTIYILTIALLNLALGYGLAVALGHALGGNLHRLSVGNVGDSPNSPASTSPAKTPDARAASAAVNVSGAPPTRRAEDAELTVPREQVQATLDEFEAEFERYRAMLADVDERVRACVETPQLDAVTACRDDLHGANEAYVQNQSNFLERLRQTEESGGSDPMTNWLSGAVATQTEQVRALNDQLEAIDLEANVLSGCQQLLDRTEQLANVNTGLRDVLDNARHEFAWRDQEPAPADTVSPNFLNNMASRAALERALAEWWRQDPERLRPLTVGLVDVDQLNEINEQFGEQTGNNVLQALAAVVATVTRGDDLAARCGGQRVLIMFPDTSSRNSTSAVERVRQSIGSTRFVKGTEVLRVSVTCAVAEAVAADTVAGLLARVEATLAEARSFGGNRTFLHDGKFPAPVVPPPFSLEPKSLSV